MVGDKELVPACHQYLKVVAERATESESHLEGGGIHCTDRVVRVVIGVVYGEKTAARKNHTQEGASCGCTLVGAGEPQCALALGLHGTGTC